MLNRNAKLLFWANFISSIGTWSTSLVIFNWLYLITGSVSLLGVGIFLHRLPIGLGAFFLNKKVYKNPQNIRIQLDIIRGVILLLMSLIVYVQLDDIFLSSYSKSLMIVIFLVLVLLRSFCSGIELSIDSHLIDVFNEFKESSTGKSQRILQGILGLTGSIASIFYILGAKCIKLHGVLAFDAFSYFFSAMLVYQIVLSSREINQNNLVENKSLFKILKLNPTIYPYFWGQCFRVFSMSMLLQQAILLLKHDYNFKEDGSGWLYFILTLAWFLAAKIVDKYKIILSPVSFLLGNLMVALGSIAYLSINTLWGVCAYTFFIWFIDGILLTVTRERIQTQSIKNHAPSIFSTLTFFTNFYLVIGALIVGWLTDLLGWNIAIVNFSMLGACITLLISVYTYIVFSLKDFVHIKNLFLQNNFNVKTFLFYGNLSKFFQFFVKGNIKSSLAVIEISESILKNNDTNLISGASGGLSKSINVDILCNRLNIAAFESLERFTAKYNISIQGLRLNPYSNGIALGKNEIMAKRNACFELVERDSFLAHFYTNKLPLFQCDLLNVDGENLFYEYDLKKSFNQLRLFRLQSSDKNIAVFCVFLAAHHHYSLGWAAIAVECVIDGIKKAIDEAINSFRVHSIVEKKPVRDFISSLTINQRSSLRNSDFSDLKNLSHAEVQIANVLTHPDLMTHIQFLWDAPLLTSLKDVLNFQDQDTWLSPLDPQYLKLESPFSVLYAVYQCTSAHAFIPRWPIILPDEIFLIASRKKIAHQLVKDKFNFPCPVY